MKKFIFILVAFFTCLTFNACGNSDKVRVEAGDGSTVSVDIFTLGVGLGVDISECIPRYQLTEFIQDQCDILKRRCNNERTFVPTSVGFLKFQDTISVACGSKNITLYKYQCDVKGYAKNAFGVEDDVQLYVGSDFFDEPRFVIKDNFDNTQVYYFISQYPNESIFVEIPFEYEGTKYYISTTCKTADEFYNELRH